MFEAGRVGSGWTGRDDLAWAFSGVKGATPKSYALPQAMTVKGFTQQAESVDAPSSARAKDVDSDPRPVDNPRGGSRLRLCLVRTARGERRAEWSGAVALRPLSETGRAQANGLADWLARFEIDSIACGRSLRSRQTLEPLARRLEKPILVDDRLDRDAMADETFARVRELAETRAVVCLAQPVLQTVLEGLLGAETSAFETRCERGGAWMIEGDPPRVMYFSPRIASSDLGRSPEKLETVPLSSRGKKLSSKARVAVLDLGSTSFHLLVADWTPDGEIERVARERLMLRMGSELARSDEVSPELLDRSVDAVERLRAFAKEHKARELVAVATAALREASNGREVLRALEVALGGPIHLLSGEEEARIVYRAIRSRIDLGRRTQIGLDLGGGSLEIVIGRGKKILFDRTLPLGVARMQGSIAPDDPHTNDDLRRLRRRIREEMAPLNDAIARFDPEGCVAVGGTARALGRLVLRERGERSASLRGLRIERSELVRIGEELSRSTHAERLERPGVIARRADLLPFGAEILASVLGQLGLPALVVSDWGLREGVLLELLDPPRR